MVLQNYQNLIEMTSNIFIIIALGVGFKCLRKIHLNTQCPPPPSWKIVTSFMDGPLTVTEVRQLFFTTTCVITITTVIINGGLTVPVLTFLQVSMTSGEILRLAEHSNIPYFLFRIIIMSGDQRR